jgi:hypothetical protein
VVMPPFRFRRYITHDHNLGHRYMPYRVGVALTYGTTSLNALGSIDTQGYAGFFTKISKVVSVKNPTSWAHKVRGCGVL